MKITITYRTYQQTGPDDYEVFTKVVHFNKTDTLREVHEKLTENYSKEQNKGFDAEIHFVDDEATHE